MRTALPLFASGALIMTLVALAFMLTGSPQHQRRLALDERRSELLDEMTRAIANDYRYHKLLPERLPAQLLKRDPESGKPFEYRRLSSDSFQLCATFAQSKSSDEFLQFENHGRGRQCFSRMLTQL